MMKRTMLLFAMVFGITLFCVAQSNVDVLHLKDGSIIRGQVVEETPQQVKIKLSDGSIFVYNADLVDKIVTETYSYRRERRDMRPIKRDRGLRGYNGFIESGFTFGDETCFDIISTVHGYQFNNYLFLGGGMALHDYGGGIGDYDDNYFAVPIFFNFRANFLNKKVTPFADARLGYTYGDIEGAYGSIGIGIRFGLSNGKKALNLLVSATAQDCEYLDGYYSGYYYDYYDDTIFGASFKIGFEF